MLMKAFSMFYIMLCFAMGFMLLFYPWMFPWTSNFFAHHHPWIQALTRNDYFRGAVSGIGLADIGLAAYEILRYRRRGRHAEPSPGVSI
jgi:hypothetical protein